MSVRVLYFASLRDAAGCESESVERDRSLADLYETLADRHGFALRKAQVRVAVNGDFVAWERELADGDEVVFLPPVSGG